MENNYIYLDFESDSNKHFFLAGYKVGSNFKQTVLSDDLKGLAKALCLETMNINTFVKNILNEALTNKRTIVAFTKNEKEIIKQYVPKSDLSKIDYLDIHKAIKRFINKEPIRKQKFLEYKNQFGNSDGFSLLNVMGFISGERPINYAPKKTSKRFKLLEKSLLAKKQEYCKITRHRKSETTKALQHNQHDVESLRYLHDFILKNDPKILEKFTTKI